MILTEQEIAVQEVATIGLMLLPNGEPGVRFNGTHEFGEAPTVVRVALLIAAIQLCAAAITAICDDNPDDSPDVDALMNAITIMPSNQSVN